MTRRTELTLVMLLLAVFGVSVVSTLDRVDTTVDERALFAAGRSIVIQGTWETQVERFHGPLPLVVQQLGVPTDASSALTPDAQYPARLANLIFGWITAIVLYAWVRGVHGTRTALFALTLCVLHPLLIGYTGLITVDMAHTAFVLMTFWFLSRFVERPGWPWLVAMGCALGAAIGSKYLALLWGVVACLAMLVATWRADATTSLPQGDASRPAPRRRHAVQLTRCLVHLVILALVTLLALHACYGFRAPFPAGDKELYESTLVRTLLDLPCVDVFVQLAPRPFLEGLDFQFANAGASFPIYVRGEFAHGQPGYYVWSLLTKTPEPILALSVFGMARGTWHLLRRRGTIRERTTFALATLAIAFPLLYLSLCTSYQLGIRYALPTVPFLVLLAATSIPRGWSRGKALAIMLPVTAYLAVDAATNWPNEIAYFNRASGGKANAYRWFRDSNADWGQMDHAGREWIESHYPEAIFLGPQEGARTGVLAIRGIDLLRLPAHRVGKADHWLLPFPPIDHVEAAWWIFDVSLAALERSYREGRTTALDLATACCADGAFERVRQLLPEVPERERALLQRWLELQSTNEPVNAAERNELALLWIELRRPDRVIAMTREDAAAIDPYLVGLAHYRGDRIRLAIATLERIDTLERRPEAVFLLTELYHRSLQLEKMLALLEHAWPHLDETQRAWATRARAIAEKGLNMQRHLEHVERD